MKNTPNYSIVSKPISNGKKFQFDCIDQDGNVIGTRKSARAYVKAMIVRNSKAKTIKSLQDQVQHKAKEAARYISAHNMTREKFISSKHNTSEFCLARYDKGDYSVWADEIVADMKEMDKEIADIKAGELDHKFLPYVYSWHQSVTAKTENLANYIPEEIGIALA